MLNDKNIYKEIEGDKNRKSMNKIHRLTEQFRTYLKEEDRDYTVNFEYKESNLYGLLKIHKCKSLKDEIGRSKSEYIVLKCPADLKFHQIVAGPSSPTSRLSHFIDSSSNNSPKVPKFMYGTRLIFFPNSKDAYLVISNTSCQYLRLKIYIQI